MELQVLVKANQTQQSREISQEDGPTDEQVNVLETNQTQQSREISQENGSIHEHVNVLETIQTQQRRVISQEDGPTDEHVNVLETIQTQQRRVISQEDGPTDEHVNVLETIQTQQRRVISQEDGPTDEHVNVLEAIQTQQSRVISQEDGPTDEHVNVLETIQTQQSREISQEDGPTDEQVNVLETIQTQQSREISQENGSIHEHVNVLETIQTQHSTVISQEDGPTDEHVNALETNQTQQSRGISLEDGPTDEHTVGLGLASYPQFASSAYRRATFTGCNPEHPQRIDDLVASGFYYAGYADCVRCFMCGLSLKGWRPKDIPAYQHSRFRPNCVYNKMCNGQEYIDKVKQELREEQSKAKGGEAVTLPTSERNQSNTSAALSQSMNNTPERQLILEGIFLLKREQFILNKKIQCQICEERTVDCLFLPCGHLKVCYCCGDELSHCISCQSQIKASVKVYVS